MGSRLWIWRCRSICRDQVSRRPFEAGPIQSHRPLQSFLVCSWCFRFYWCRLWQDVCRFVWHRAYYGIVYGVQWRCTIVVPFQLFARPAWLNWINFVSSRCCAQLACVGFDTRGKLKWHLPRSDKWKSTNQAPTSMLYRIRSVNSFEYHSSTAVLLRSGCMKNTSSCLHTTRLWSSTVCWISCRGVFQTNTKNVCQNSVF